MRFVLLLVCLTAGLYAEVLFVRPVMQPDARLGTMASVVRQQVGERSFLKFTQDTMPADLAAAFQQSPLMEEVLRLRALAFDIAAQQNRPLPDTRDLLIYAGDDLGKAGPAMASGMPVFLEHLGTTATSLMVLSTMRSGNVELPIDAFVKGKYLKAVLAHEVFHEIMGFLYGDEMLTVKARSTSRKGHDSHLVTDPFLAFLEGTAEALEIAVAQQFPQEVATRASESLQLNPSQAVLLEGFIKRRIQLAGANRFVFAQDGAALDGAVDDPNTLLSTEGNIASLFYRVMFRSGVEDAVTKVFHVLGAIRPHDLMEFLEGFAALYPQDWAGVRRQFLESTYYVTVSRDAAEAYRHSYLQKKQFKQAKVSRADADVASEAWKQLKESLLSDLDQGRLKLGSNIRTPYMVSDQGLFYRVDLNQARADEIQDVLLELMDTHGLNEDAATVTARIMRYREQGVIICDMDSVDLPESVEEVLKKANVLYLEHERSQLEQKRSKLAQSFYHAYMSDLSELLVEHSR